MFDINQRIYDKDGELDEYALEDYCDGLMQAFADSPEGRAFEEYNGRLGCPHTLLYFGLTYLGTNAPEMSPRDVEEVLFDIFPRKVSVEASEAGEIIGELRAFWEFLAREYELPNAAAILKVLDKKAERRLEQELSNPGNFGMAKSMFMMGSRAGFDMTSQKGLNEFMMAYNQSPMAGRSTPDDRSEQSFDDEAFEQDSWTARSQPREPTLTAEERRQQRKERRKKMKNAKRRKR